VGWALGRDHWGRGYATEAGAAAVAWAGDVELVALIAPGNARSVRVAEKLGFALRGPFGAADVYARPAPGTPAAAGV
jgi:RimJ/RimL family protein N-acetyltransferase